MLDTVFTHKGDQLVSVGRDMSAKLTEVATQRFIDNISSITPGALRGGLQAVARHPQREEFLVGGSDGVPQAYRIVRKVQRRIGDNALCIRKWPAMEGRVYAVAFAPDGTKFAAASSLDGKGAVSFFNYDFNTEMPADIVAIEGKEARTDDDEAKLEAHYTSETKLIASVPFDAGISRFGVSAPTARDSQSPAETAVRFLAADAKVLKEFVPSLSYARRAPRSNRPPADASIDPRIPALAFTLLTLGTASIFANALTLNGEKPARKRSAGAQV